MELFASLQKKRDLERLEQQLKERPTQENFLVLIKKYQGLGDLFSALRVAKQAIQEFPNEEELSQIYYNLKKKHCQTEIDSLLKIIQQEPTSIAFSQLAEIYKDLHEEEIALKYCRQSIELFPDNDNPYLTIGELRLRRFYKDFLANDAKLAIENLERVLELNNKNYRALLTLSKLYLQIGLISKARQRISSILLFAPEDEKVLHLLNLSSSIPKAPQEDLDILLHNIETERKLYYNLEKESQEEEEKNPLSQEMFVKPLEALQKTNIDNLLALFICDEYGNCMGYYAKPDVDAEIYYDVGMYIYQTVQNSSRQMDLGRLQKTEIDSPIGCIHIQCSENIIYLGFSTPEARKEHLSQHLQFLIKEVSQQLKQASSV